MLWLSLAVTVVGVTHVGLLVLALLAWRRGVRQSRFFVASFGCLFAGTLPGRALLLMIEDLVLWARLRAGSRVVSNHQARALLAPAVALHRSLAQHRGTELVLEVPEGLRVETDVVLAQTLVRNLLANALKFAPTRVVLHAEAQGSDVRFTVSNDGPPLPASVAARLAVNENEPMTAMGGLGLRRCREICQALDPRLEACAPTEGGAEFSFMIKATEEAVEENA